ncbi:MAG: polymer-forming cytoskeletal protein [Lachnospiraceae bacterium]|nr:polymer-forming cytoskeletal protein [Lachnospiraceae bacterium]
MGFFGDLKQDLSQAVNELIPEENTENTAEETNSEETLTAEASSEEKAEEASDMPDVSAMLDAIDESSPLSDDDYEKLLNEAIGGEISSEDSDKDENSKSAEADDAETALDSVFADMEAEKEAAVTEETVEPAIEDNNFEDNTFKGADFKMDSNANYSDETSVITLGMTVNGDINTEGSLEILGNVKGNIDVAGKLNITGHVTGNSKAHEIFAENAKITGDVASESSIKIGAGTVIVGNITGFSAAVAGAVKGDIDVHGPVILDSSAIVMGNIRSKSVQINNGAAIEGMCSQCYADVSPTSFFDDYKADSIPKKNKNDK